MINSVLSFEKEATVRCEYLVIGSGAGGALTASFLAEKGKNVLIVEEGPYVRPTVEQSSINNFLPKIWRNGGIMPILGKTSFSMAEGCCVGGSTMINSALIHRIPRELIGEWSSRFQIAGLEEKSIRKYHDTIEKELNVHTIETSHNKANSLFKLGAEHCGYKGIEVPMAVEKRNGRLIKKDMQQTYLRRAIQNGAKIIADCRAGKIHFNGNKAVSCDAVYKDIYGEKHKITIFFKGIFLCAGAIQTPLLLRRSGIKNNVGNNIYFHPTLRVVAEFDTVMDTLKSEIPCFQLKEFAPDISMGASVVTPAYIAVGLSGNWDQNKQFIKNWDKMAIFYIMIRCSSRGKTRNLISNKKSYYVKYHINEKELKNLSFGFAKLAEVLFSAGAKRLYPAIDDHEPVTDRKDTDFYLHNLLPADRTNLMTIHAFSSCAMGENKNLCAVDSFGKLHDFKNVYINDASILPNSPGVNPQGPLMAIALRNLEKYFGN
jgi:choline dehydrogenase-like flavoprotein